MIYWPFDSVVTEVDGVDTYDREFNSENLRAIFSMLYTDGIVMASDSGAMLVSAAGGMVLSVAPGACIIQGAMGKETDTTSFTIPAANASLPRIDSVIVRLNTNLAVRSIAIAYLTGTAASSPTAPELSRTNGVYELRLANIAVAAGATSVTASSITDTRLSSECGLATARPQTVDTENIFEQYQTALNEFLAYADSCMDDTVAGNLQAEITEMKDGTVEGSLQNQINTLQAAIDDDDSSDVVDESFVVFSTTWKGLAVSMSIYNSAYVFVVVHGTASEEINTKSAWVTIQDMSSYFTMPRVVEGYAVINSIQRIRYRIGTDNIFKIGYGINVAGGGAEKIASGYYVSFNFVFPLR